MLAALKKAVATSGSPTANMWCAQTPKLRKPMLTLESASAM